MTENLMLSTNKQFIGAGVGGVEGNCRCLIEGRGIIEIEGSNQTRNRYK